MPWFKKRSDTPARVANDTSPNAVYSGLRQQALARKGADIGITPSADAPAWGVLMESRYKSVTMTLMALGDGTTSMYLSNGGGVIGGQGHEAVRHVNAAFLNQANQSLSHLKRCETFPIPELGQTIFYVLTDSGVLTGSGADDHLANGNHQLSTLFHAGHAVINQLRVASETGDA